MTPLLGMTHRGSRVLPRTSARRTRSPQVEPKAAGDGVPVPAWGVSHYDDVAARYDATRGGEPRGDELAALIDARLPRRPGIVLDVGCGTGVVALGLRRRGWPVLGIDRSVAMLRRAAGRLGPAVAQADVRALPVAEGSIAHAVSVWVVHHVEEPVRLFLEVRRVLRPGGCYVVLPNYRYGPGDPIGPILLALHQRAWARTGERPAVPLDAAAILPVATEAGFAASVDTVETGPRATTALAEIAAIEARAYPALVGLDASAFEDVTGPALAELAALPEGPILRPAIADVLVLHPC